MSHFPSRVDLRPRRAKGLHEPVYKTVERIAEVFPAKTTARSMLPSPSVEDVAALADLAAHPDDRVFAALLPPLGEWHVPDPFIAYLSTTGKIKASEVKYLKSYRSPGLIPADMVEASSRLWEALMSSAIASVGDHAWSYRMDRLAGHVAKTAEAVKYSILPLPFPLPGSPSFVPASLLPARAALSDHIRGCGLRDALSLARSSDPSIPLEVARCSAAISDPDLVVDLASADDVVPMLESLLANPHLGNASLLVIWDWVLAMGARKKNREAISVVASLLRASGHVMPAEVKRRARLALSANGGGSGWILDSLAVMPDVISDPVFWDEFTLSMNHQRALSSLAAASGPSFVKVLRLLVEEFTVGPGDKLFDALSGVEAWQLEGVSPAQLMFLLDARSDALRTAGRQLALKCSPRLEARRV